MERRHARRLWQVVGAAVLGAVSLVYAFPLYWLLVTALKGEGELYRATPSLYPLEPTMAAFSRVLSIMPYHLRQSAAPRSRAFST